jgi:hypothetical protein
MSMSQIEHTYLSSSVLTHDRCQEQNPKVLKVRKDKTRQDHEPRAGKQYASPPNTIGDHGQENPQEDVPEQREGHEQADLEVGEFQLGEKQGWIESVQELRTNDHSILPNITCVMPKETILMVLAVMMR